MAAAGRTHTPALSGTAAHQAEVSRVIPATCPKSWACFTLSDYLAQLFGVILSASPTYWPYHPPSRQQAQLFGITPTTSPRFWACFTRIPNKPLFLVLFLQLAQNAGLISLHTVNKPKFLAFFRQQPQNPGLIALQIVNKAKFLVLSWQHAQEPGLVLSPFQTSPRFWRYPTIHPECPTHRALPCRLSRLENVPRTVHRHAFRLL